MQLNYKAVNRNGKVIHGIVDARDINQAGLYLRNKDLLPVSVVPKTEFNFTKYIPFLNNTSKDIVFFTRQLSSMMEAGLTLIQSLRLLEDQIESQRMKEIISNLILDIEDGSSFAQAIQRYPRIFGSIYIALIKAAESSGLLDNILLRLADNLEKAQKLKSTIKGALMYPVIVLVGMVIVMFIMMIFVVPQLTTLYTSMNIELPLPTKIVIAISTYAQIFWPIFLGVTLTLYIGFNRWRKTDSGRLITDSLFLKIPVFGKLMMEQNITEFTRTFGLLIGAGTLVVDALNQAADTAGNLLYSNAIRAVGRSVEKGVTVGDAMSYSPLFPPIVVEMAKIGIETGKLDESMLRMSEYFEREVEQTVKTLTTLMEPFIMVVLGVGVAFLVLSVISPIYKLTSSIQ